MTTKYKLAPIEPTEEMLLAAKSEMGDHNSYRDWCEYGYKDEAVAIYKAMLEASPAQESEPVGYTSQGYIDGVKNSIGDLGNFAGNFFKNKYQKVDIPLYTHPPADKADAERWQWLIGRKLSLGKVIDISNETATVMQGDDETRILLSELLEEDYKAQDRYHNNINESFNTGNGDYKP